MSTTHSETATSHWNQGLLPRKQSHTQDLSIFLSPTLPHVLEELGHKRKGREGRELCTKHVIKNFKILNFNI